MAPDIDALRDQMFALTGDVEFIERTIAKIMRERAPRVIKPEPAKAKPYEVEMAEASERMALAVQAAMFGRATKTPDKLLWRSKSGTEISNNTGANSYLYQPDTVELNRVSRDPCPKCAVRADIGCKHNPSHRRETDAHTQGAMS